MNSTHAPFLQNKQGNTALHFAMSYQFYDPLGSWLTDPEQGAGADDSLMNKFELGVYDGLAP